MYKFKENIILDDVKMYIDKTYRSHYSTTHRQATEIIIDQGHGEGFCMGNILKYAQRYGKKDGKNKNDLMKVIHYAMIQLSQDHYNNDKSLFDSLREDLLEHDIGKWDDNQPLRNPMAEKLNNPND